MTGAPAALDLAADGASQAILPRRGGLLGRLSDLYWRRPGLLLLLMLLPPVLWLGIVYVGSLFALLLQSSRSRPMGSCFSRPISTSSCARW